MRNVWPAPHVLQAIQAAMRRPENRAPAPHVAAVIARTSSTRADVGSAQPRTPNGAPAALSSIGANHRFSELAPHVSTAITQVFTPPTGTPPQPAFTSVQRAEENPYRVERKSYRKAPKSARLREKQEERRGKASRGLPYARLSKKITKGYWDEQGRPSFTEDTWKKMLGELDSAEDANTGITLYKCPVNHAILGDHWVPRKRDLAGLTAKKLEDHFGKDPGESKTDFLGRANVITLDHHMQWKIYIWSAAEPDDAGKITKAAAREAYNDTANLVAMCGSCNSSKNGRKGVMD